MSDGYGGRGDGEWRMSARSARWQEEEEGWAPKEPRRLEKLIYTGGSRCYVVSSHKKRASRCYVGPIFEKGLPGRVDTSGTKKTIKTGKLWKCDLP